MIVKYQMPFVYQRLTRLGERLPALAIGDNAAASEQKSGELREEGHGALQPLYGALPSKRYHDVEHPGADCLSC